MTLHLLFVPVNGTERQVKKKYGVDKRRLPYKEDRSKLQAKKTKQNNNNNNKKKKTSVKSKENPEDAS